MSDTAAPARPAPAGVTAPAATGSVGVVSLGSSSSEVLDYVFEKSDHYHSFWASGWSARGLRGGDTQSYLRTILQEPSRDSLVLMNFGLVDIMFSARRKAILEGYYDFGTFLKETAEGILRATSFVNGLGFADVRAIFPSPVPHLSQVYWNQFAVSGRQIPSQMMGRMYYDLSLALQKELPVIDCFEALSNGEKGGFLLKRDFFKSEADHHPDYIKTQGIVREALTRTGRTLPFRAEPLSAPYASASYHIKILKKKNTHRRNTQI